MAAVERTLVTVRRFRFNVGVDLNSAVTDVATFTGLPAKYRVTRLMVYDASTSLSLATAGLFTAASGGGTAVVAAGALSALTGATKILDMTLALTTDYLTVATLYLRNVTPQGGAATASFMLEIQELY